MSMAIVSPGLEDGAAAAAAAAAAGTNGSANQSAIHPSQQQLKAEQKDEKDGHSHQKTAQELNKDISEKSHLAPAAVNVHVPWETEDKQRGLSLEQRHQQEKERRQSNLHTLPPLIEGPNPSPSPSPSSASSSPPPGGPLSASAMTSPAAPGNAASASSSSPAIGTLPADDPALSASVNRRTSEAQKRVLETTRIDRWGNIFSTAAEESSSSAAEPPKPLTAEEKAARARRLQLDQDREVKWVRMVDEWDVVVAKKKDKLKRRIRKGIPDSLRGAVWTRLAGVHDILGAKANGALSSSSSSAPAGSNLSQKGPGIYAKYFNQPSKEQDTIQRDIARTFPHHVLFRDRDPASDPAGTGENVLDEVQHTKNNDAQGKNSLGRSSLYNVLKAYSIHDEKVGYCLTGDHDVLVEHRGWVPINQVHSGERVWSLLNVVPESPRSGDSAPSAGNAGWSRVERTIRKDVPRDYYWDAFFTRHFGKMLTVKSSSSSPASVSAAEALRCAIPMLIKSFLAPNDLAPFQVYHPQFGHTIVRSYSLYEFRSPQSNFLVTPGHRILTHACTDGDSKAVRWQISRADSNSFSRNRYLPLAGVNVEPFYQWPVHDMPFLPPQINKDPALQDAWCEFLGFFVEKGTLQLIHDQPEMKLVRLPAPMTSGKQDASSRIKDLLQRLGWLSENAAAPNPTAQPCFYHSSDSKGFEAAHNSLSEFLAPMICVTGERSLYYEWCTLLNAQQSKSIIKGWVLAAGELNSLEGSDQLAGCTTSRQLRDDVMVIAAKGGLPCTARASEPLQPLKSQWQLQFHRRVGDPDQLVSVRAFDQERSVVRVSAAAHQQVYCLTVDSGNFLVRRNPAGGDHAAMHMQFVCNCQGMGFPTGMFLMYLNEEESFWMLYSIARDPKYNLNGMWSPGFPLLFQYFYIYDALMKKLVPQVHSHLNAQDPKIVPELYATHWFMTGYSYSLPPEVYLRIWDILLSEGTKVLFRVAIHFCQLLQKDILAESELAILDVFKNVNKHAALQDPDKFIDGVLKVSISTEDINKLAKDYDAMKFKESQAKLKAK